MKELLGPSISKAISPLLPGREVNRSTDIIQNPRSERRIVSHQRKQAIVHSGLKHYNQDLQ